jgi:hypothetical protein
MTPAEIQAIFNDKTTFTDTMELTIGDKKFTLGDLRGLSDSQQRQVAEKIAGADRREAEARDTATKAANLLAELETARTKLVEQKTKPATDDDFDKEEFWGPVRKRFTERDEKIDQAIKGLDALTKSVTQAATIWAEDRWQAQFEKNAPRLKKVDQYKDWDYAKVRDYAAQQKLLDNHGFPSVEKAILELTKASDIDTIRKEAYAEGMKAAKQRNRLDNQPRPSSATGGKQPADKSAVAEMGLEGLGDDAMNDPELMEMFAQIQNGGEVQ